MEEKVDELYNKYLSTRLNHVFITEEKQKTNNIHKEYVGGEELNYRLVDDFNDPINDKLYEHVLHIESGYAIVENGNHKNIVDHNGNELFKEWYDDVTFFYNGYSIVKKNGKYNLVDKKGKLVSDTWYKEVSNFHCGCARVVRVDKSSSYGLREENFIDTNGNIICDKWFDKVENFSEGFAVVRRKDDYYHHIDTKGNRLGNYNYPWVGSFVNGYADVKLSRHCYRYINTKGEYISDDVYDQRSDFRQCGLAKVHSSRYIHFIDGTGKSVCGHYDEAESFEGDYAVVRNYFQGYSVINTKGQHVLKDKFDEVIINSKEGYFRVKKDSKYNFSGPIAFERNKEYLSDIWFEDAETFRDGLSRVVLNKKYNFIDKQGKLLCKKSYSWASAFEKGHALVRNGKNYNLIDTNGNELCKWSKNEPNLEKVYHDFVECDDYGFMCITTDLNGYKVKKTLRGYKCSKDDDSFTVPYEPVKIYGKNIIFYIKKNKKIECRDLAMMYNRKTLKEEYLFIASYIEFHDNLILDKYHKKTYLFYHDDIYDISEYYNSYLKYRKIVSINDNVTILPKEIFSSHNEEEIKELVRQEQEQEEQEEENRRLQEAKENDIRQKEEKISKHEKTIKELQVLVRTLEDLGLDIDDNHKLKVKNLFVPVNSHKEIDSKYLEAGLLKYIDLSTESFINAKIDGLDFRGCNINFGPNDLQEIYDRNLSNCNFEGIHIPAFLDFTDVDIRGSRFSDDNDPKTVDGQNVYFKEAIYDERTTYNGIPFTMIYGECKKTKGKNYKKTM